MNAQTFKPLLFLLLACGGSYAFTVEGVVVDGRKNTNVPFANVHLLDSKMVEKCGTAADADGRFKFVNVVPGVYSIKVASFGFGDTTFASIKIIEDTSLVLDIYRFCKYDDSSNDKTCPVCHKSDQVIPIQYGLPASEQKGKKKKGADDDFYPGGENTNCDPNWYCKRDQHKF